MTLRIYSVRMGPNWVLHEATSPERAIEGVAERMKVAHKPWVFRDWTARLATSEDVERYAALADAKKDPRKVARTGTLTTLRKRHPGFFDPPDAA